MPCITWLLPFIGHTGIATTDGKINDFDGPYHISVDNFAFGRTLKYVVCEVEEERYAEWDECVDEANKEYRGRNHQLCCDNCHSHVARALNNYRYMGRENWTMVSVWWLLITSGKYVSCGAVLKTYLPFLIICALIATIAVLT